MALDPRPGTRWRVTEQRRRQVYSFVAIVASAVQAGIAGIDLARHPGQLPTEALAGAVICGGAAALLCWRRVPWRWVDWAVLAAATLSVLTQLALAWAAGQPLEPRLLLTGVFLFTAGFSILPAVWAAAYSAVVFTVFAAFQLTHHGDVTLLAELGLSGLLIAHLSTYGQQRALERAELAVYHQLALTDALTGLENRRAMLARLNTLLGPAPGPPVAILLLDIDHFKRVNDTFGHDVGDRVLCEVAARLSRAVLSRGTVARWGGEEFLVAVPGTSPGGAAEVAQVIRQVLRCDWPTGVGVPPVTVSIGLAGAWEADSVQELLHLADARLYRAKHAGRDRLEGAAPAGSPTPHHLGH